MCNFFTNTQIGSIYESDDYTEKYYVNIYDADNNDFLYSTPALINRHEEYGKLVYELEEAYLPTGEVVSLHYILAIPYEEVYVDEYDKFVVLTNKKFVE